jgi:hypothetical protein
MRQTKITLGLVLGLATAPFTAQAGIDFDAMPVGCSWTTTYSSGEVLTETFLGKSKGKPKTKVTRADNPGAVIRHSFFDKEGRLVRKEWAGGKWESFTPFSCFSETGSCTYRYRNADGADQKIVSKTAAKGKGFSVKAGPEGEARYPDEYFELGAFGLTTVNRADNYSAKLIKMVNCGLES